MLALRLTALFCAALCLSGGRYAYSTETQHGTAADKPRATAYIGADLRFSTTDSLLGYGRINLSAIPTRSSTRIYLLIGIAKAHAEWSQVEEATLSIGPADTSEMPQTTMLEGRARSQTMSRGVYESFEVVLSRRQLRHLLATPETTSIQIGHTEFCFSEMDITPFRHFFSEYESIVTRPFESKPTPPRELTHEHEFRPPPPDIARTDV